MLEDFLEPIGERMQVFRRKLALVEGADSFSEDNGKRIGEKIFGSVKKEF